MIPVAFQKYFQFIGVVVSSYLVLRIALKVFYNVYVFKIAGFINFKKYGNWAVVTGCTDGIGKAYAEKLAKLGMNIVLISRSAEKLNAQSEEIKSKYKVETKVVAADFSEENLIYHKIKEQLEDLKIGILVNNVGISYQYPEYLDELPETDRTINNLLHCNVTSMTKMSAIVLPGMVKRHGGIIVNLSSGSGRVATPLLTVYSATKAYADFFSRALSVEYASKGIIVQSVCPYFVATNLSKLRKAFTVPNPTEFVDSALRTIGRETVTNGCLVHNLQGWMYESLPTGLYNNFALKGMLAVRKKALKKLASKKRIKKIISKFKNSLFQFSLF